MKLSNLILLTVCSAVAAAVSTNDAMGKKNDASTNDAVLKNKEDEFYWNRLMEETQSSIQPTEAPPTGSPPTDAPPTVSPTVEPKVCECDVKIECETEDGIECNDFSIPTLSCASPVDIVRFNYTGGDCSTSNNAQGDSTCVDSNGGPPDGRVQVACGRAVANVFLTKILVVPGEKVPVVGPPLGLLSCNVTSTDEAIVYQELTFSTLSSFTAKARFGSLEVERCDDLDCIVDVTYTYTASNVGEAPINITSMTRTREGEMIDLIDSVDPTELDVGEQTVVEEPDKVDYCVSGSITTQVNISSNGEQCAVMLTRRGLLRHSKPTFEEAVVKMVLYDLSIDVN